MEDLYSLYNRRELIHPDPLEFLYHYRDPLDREVVGIVASSLAYGRVSQILASVSRVLDRMGESPCRFLMGSSRTDLLARFKDFKHRFTTGEHLTGLLCGVKQALRRHGSLQACFRAGLNEEDVTVLPALTAFVRELSGGGQELEGMLLPSPAKGSACKRLNLFLRWMVRCDDVDPGVWTGVSPSQLVVPLDTHMHRIGIGLNLTARKQADMRTALEVTGLFRSIVPEDPVRYDFALTRLGIRENMGLTELPCPLTGCSGSIAAS